MRADHEGDWEGDDSRLVMPDRDVYVVQGAMGPVRLLDITPEQTNPEMLELLERMSEQETHAFNRLAYPAGGLQWDWRLRTLWFWEGPPPRPRPKAVKQGSRSTPAAAPPPRSPHVALRSRLERLLAQPAPAPPTSSTSPRPSAPSSGPTGPATPAPSTASSCATSWPPAPWPLPSSTASPGASPARGSVSRRPGAGFSWSGWHPLGRVLSIQTVASPTPSSCHPRLDRG
jgi:hypothetical protein